MLKPLYPEHGQEYLTAMLQAAEEYDTWVDSRRGKKQGITIYSRKQQESADADI